MTKLLELRDGTLVPLTAIRAFRPLGWDKSADALVYLAIGLDGDTLGTATRPAISSVEGENVPAQTGWRIGFYSRPGDGEFEIWFEPVVAWRIADGYAQPVTCEGNIVDTLYYVLVAPCGHTTAPLSNTWVSLEKAEAWLRERHEERAAEIAMEEATAGHA